MSDNYNINIVHSESDAKTRNEIEGGAQGGRGTRLQILSRVGNTDPAQLIISSEYS